MSRPHPALLDLVGGRRVAIADREAAAAVVSSATEHALAGQLLAAVEDRRAELPPPALMTLSAYDATIVDRQRRLWSVLAGCLARLGEVGIDAYAIKGVTNEARWYGRLGQRPSTDIDLVVAPHHLDRVGEVIDLLAPDHPARATADELVRRRRLQHVHFVREGVAVDLHFDPLKLGTWTRRPDRWWATATTIDGPDGVPVPVLSPSAALALALVHLNKDRFAYLGGYVEVARMLLDPDLDPDEVERIGADEGISVPLRAALAEVVDRLDLDPDRPWRRPTGAGAVLWRRLWPRRAMLHGHDARDVHRFRQSLLPHLQRGRTVEALLELRRRAVPPRDLLDLHRPELSHHHYLRRVTLDRLPTRAGPVTGGGDPPR